VFGGGSSISFSNEFPSLPKYSGSHIKRILNSDSKGFNDRDFEISRHSANGIFACFFSASNTCIHWSIPMYGLSNIALRHSPIISLLFSPFSLGNGKLKCKSGCVNVAYFRQEEHSPQESVSVRFRQLMYFA